MNVATSSTDVDLDSIILNTTGEADQSVTIPTGASAGMTIGIEDDYEDSDDESGSEISDSEIATGTTLGVGTGQVKT